MSTELTTLNVSDIMSIGKAFYESGMFTDIKSAAQAVVKITAGKEMGIPPFAAMSGIHIIVGKPTVGAGLMAANVKGSGKYDYRVVEQSDKVCSIDFMQKVGKMVDGKLLDAYEKIGNSTFTIEDAKKAGTKNIDKFPKNMLFARAISNGVKWFCPDIFNGPVYVPEEMEGVTETPITEDVKHEVVAPDPAIEAEAKLRACENLPQLQVAFKSLPKELQVALVAVKDEMKGKLSPLPGVAIV